MKSLFCLVCAALCVSRSSWSTDAIWPAVYQGRTLSENSNTWRSVVQLLFFRKAAGSSDVKVNSCTGTFVSRTKILTARHCFGDATGMIEVLIVFFEGSKIYKTVALETSPLESSRVVFLGLRIQGISETGVIELLDGSVFPNENYQPMPFHRDGDPPIERTYGAGAGANGYDSNPIEEFYNGTIELKYLPLRYLYRRAGFLGYRALEGQICSGDSGGPLMGADQSGKLYIMGLQHSVNGPTRGLVSCGQEVFYAPVNRWLADWVSGAQ